VVAIDHARGNLVSLRWLLYDGHGNLVRTMAPDYTLSAFQWRGVWGEVQGSLGTGRGYCANLGHPEDETGLVYMRARYYEPATGRFISEDPARDGVNWYLYADGNPVGKVDGDGRESDFEAALYQLVGNLMVAIGRALLDNGSMPPTTWDELLAYAKKRAIKYGIEYLSNHDEGIKAILKLLNFIINTAKKLSEGVPGDELAKRWAGYYWVILGQLLLTDADIASPGEGEWWGYGTKWPF